MIHRSSRAPSKSSSAAAIVCLAGSPFTKRHLQPIARVGGWPLWTPQELSGQKLHSTLVVVASVSDEKIAIRLGAKGSVLCEHGAGQSYLDERLAANSVWRGGRGTAQGRLLMLTPGPHLARRHRRSHPTIPVEVVGCPVLDAWHGKAWNRNTQPVVALSTHWDSKTLPETRSSWPWVRQALARLAQDPRWTLIGHYHPHEQATGTLPARLADYAAAGIEVVPRWEDVLQQADLYLCDNSSTLFEFAATDRPVVVLQPPWYRRSARHGLRFYDAVPGHLADQLDQLPDCIAEALLDPPKWEEARRQAVHRVYGTLDGQATQRAVAAIQRCFARLKD